MSDTPKSPAKTAEKSTPRAASPARAAARSASPAKSTPGDKRRRGQPTRPRTEGQRRLNAIPESGAEIARRIGSTRASVSAWRNGTKQPTPEARRALSDVYQIPVQAWESRPSGGRADGPSVAEVTAEVRANLPADDADLGTTIAGLEALIETMRSARRRDDLSAGELAKLVTTEGQLLERLTRAKAAAAEAETARRAVEQAERPDAHENAIEQALSITIALERMAWLALQTHPWDKARGAHPFEVVKAAVSQRPGEFPEAWFERLTSFMEHDAETLAELVKAVTWIPSKPPSWSGQEPFDAADPSYRRRVERMAETGELEEPLT